MPKLERQAIGRGDTGTIVVVQLWSGLSHGRWAVVFFKDGLVTNERSGGYAPTIDSYSHAARHLAQRPLTEDQARDLFAAAGLPRETFCTECACRLPLGGRFCTACGKPHVVRRAVIGQPAPGSNARPILFTDIPVALPAQ